MKVAISGAHGFLGWHTALRLRAVYGVDPVMLGREEFAGRHILAGALDGVDTIVHLAGVNRGDTDAEVEDGNIEIADRLADGLAQRARAVHIVYANSVQSQFDTPYGRGKARAGEKLGSITHEVGGTFANVVLPNLFGEHGRPHYNSFVATFCHAVANGGSPNVIDDKEVPLLHAQMAAQHLIDAAGRRENHECVPPTESHRVTEVLDRIQRFHDSYAIGQIPPLAESFTVDLFNTYRSYMFPQRFPFHATVNTDERGELFETVRSHGGTGQVFVSSTRPGATRGEHYHLRKVERFFVLEGTAEIALRRVLDHEVVRFRVSGNEPAFVDMPTLWVHNIRNIGDDQLLTMFWSDQLLDLEAPDTYQEAVEAEVVP